MLILLGKEHLLDSGQGSPILTRTFEAEHLPRAKASKDLRSLRAYAAALELVIVVDTREQTPLDFGPLVAVTRATLPTGDYSIQGYESEVAVERKSKSDAYGCVGAGRARFERCLLRLGAMRRGAIVIETSLKRFTTPPGRSAISPQQAVGSYISWSCQHRLPVFWCGSREYAARVTLRYLMAYVKHREAITT